MRRISRFALAAFMACALGSAACAGGGGGGKKSPRGKWLAKPQQGTTRGKITKIPGLGITFEQPEVLYVYKECGEASHSPESSENNWIPVIKCMSVFGDDSGGGGEDEWSDEGDDFGDEEAVSFTIYAAPKDVIINERAVETMRAKFQNAGFKVDELTYHEEYLAKPGRRGIEAKIQIIDTSSGFPSREILRFMFPKDDVLFIAQIDYPFGDDRSGMMSDWQRILWNFQFDEDGLLYEAQNEVWESGGK